MVGLRKIVYTGLVIFFAGVLSSFFTTTSRVSAAETRGLRVAAKDSASGEKKEVKIYNKSFAVIIGIDQYPNMKFDEQLAYAVRDARGVEQVLRKNFKFDKIITLYNKDATKDNIMKVLLGDLTREVTDQDAVFVFWASHGYTEKTSFGDLGYLVPYDGTSNTSELYKNISMTTLKDDISRKIPAKHVFYVMDACYSGLLATTRGTGRRSARDYAYLQEITREKVRQVLTAGDKGQEVLDGGPKGHSVFTGRFIEYLENADDFVTATEISNMLREKVFSDAKSRNHTQTPKYGELFGVGDFVFVPSLEQKVEDTQAMVAGLQRELEKLKATEVAAAKAQDESAKRQAEIEKRQIEARLAAERLRQRTLEEQRKKGEAEQREEAQRQAESARQKKENEGRIAMLSKEVAEKRKGMVGGATLAALSPQKALDEMQSIDRKIKDIRVRFRTELKNSILQIVNRYNPRYLKLSDAKKDEFESEPEFQQRSYKERAALDKEQTDEFTAVQNRLETEYNNQIAPLIEELKKLSGQEFTITAENLTLELGTYDGASNSYPVSIKTKKPLEIVVEEGRKTTKQVQVAAAPVAPSQPQTKGKRQTVQPPAAADLVFKTVVEQEPPKTRHVMLAANASIPIPRDEAREFKQHFEHNMLRPEIRGNFETPESFTVMEAKIIDDANTKQYDLFTAEYVDLGNGTVFDTRLKLLWAKNAQQIKFKSSSADGYKKTFDKDLKSTLSSVTIDGMRGWRLPTLTEIQTMAELKNKTHPFVSVNEVRIDNSGCSDQGFLTERPGYKSGGTIDGYITYSAGSNASNRLCGHDTGSRLVIWPVRGGR